MAILTPVRHRFYNNDGTVASGGKVYIYEPNSTIPKDSYTSSDALSLNTWPIILDSKGECDMWTSGLFKINVLQSNDVQVTGYPVDNCGASPSASLDAANVIFTPTGGIAATDVQAALAELDSEKATIVALNLKADANGNASNTFAASQAVATTDVVTLQQMRLFAIRSYSDVSGSRTQGTTYTNSTNKEITVYFTARHNTVDYAVIATINGQDVNGQTEVAAKFTTSTFDIPPGASYSIRGINSVGATVTLSFITWIELS